MVEWGGGEQAGGEGKASTLDERRATRKEPRIRDRWLRFAGTPQRFGGVPPLSVLLLARSLAHSLLTYLCGVVLRKLNLAEAMKMCYQAQAASLGDVLRRLVQRRARPRHDRERVGVTEGQHPLEYFVEREGRVIVVL